jgi:hypothetical protein
LKWLGVKVKCQTAYKSILIVNYQIVLLDLT